MRHNIPIPGLSGRKIDFLDAQQLEQSFYKALKLRRNWHSQSPVAVRRMSIMGMPNSRVIALHFITEQGRQWLISLFMSHDRQFAIQCWDLHVSPPNCIAQRELQHFRGMAINKGVSIVGSIIILNPQ